MTTPRPGDVVRVTYETTVHKDGHYRGQRLLACTGDARNITVEVIGLADDAAKDPIGTLRQTPEGAIYLKATHVHLGWRWIYVPRECARSFDEWIHDKKASHYPRVGALPGTPAYEDDVVPAPADAAAVPNHSYATEIHVHSETVNCAMGCRGDAHRLHCPKNNLWGTPLKDNIETRTSVPVGTVVSVPDSPKLLRESLCVAQTAIGDLHADNPRVRAHTDRLQRLIDECDRHRPIGPDGKHGDRHTPTCGCARGEQER